MSGRTLVTMVLDRSSSMQTIKKSVIEGYNEHLDALQREPAEISHSLVTFGDDVEISHEMTPLARVQPISASSYIPDGMTALLDGVGEAIRETDANLRENDRALVVIMTDGEENHSSHWTWNAVQAAIRAAEATGRWTFVLLGANQDPFKVANRLGIKGQNALPFTADPAGVLKVFQVVRQATMKYLTDGGKSSFFDEVTQ